MKNLLKGLVLVGIGVVGTLIITNQILKDDNDDESYMDELPEETKEEIRKIQKEMKKHVWNGVISNMIIYTVLPSIFFLIIRHNKEKQQNLVMELNYIGV